jgi:hypothetical protein
MKLKFIKKTKTGMYIIGVKTIFAVLRIFKIYPDYHSDFNEFCAEEIAYVLMYITHFTT